MRAVCSAGRPSAPRRAADVPRSGGPEEPFALDPGEGLFQEGEDDPGIELASGTRADLREEKALLDDGVDTLVLEGSQTVPQFRLLDTREFIRLFFLRSFLSDNVLNRHWCNPPKALTAPPTAP
jgi:hypothetical protein